MPATGGVLDVQRQVSGKEGNFGGDAEGGVLPEEIGGGAGVCVRVFQGQHWASGDELYIEMIRGQSKKRWARAVFVQSARSTLTQVLSRRDG